MVILKVLKECELENFDMYTAVFNPARLYSPKSRKPNLLFIVFSKLLSCYAFTDPKSGGAPSRAKPVFLLSFFVKMPCPP